MAGATVVLVVIVVVPDRVVVVVIGVSIVVSITDDVVVPPEDDVVEAVFAGEHDARHSTNAIAVARLRSRIADKPIDSIRMPVDSDPSPDKGNEITAAEFEDRLVGICLGGPLTGLPRRDRDKAILLASATLWMDPDGVYSEAEVNERLQSWLSEVCPSLGLDFVTLRRELVDRNYLDRDDSGRHYAPGRGPVAWRFADDVGELDPGVAIIKAITEKAERKRAYLERNRERPAG